MSQYSGPPSEMTATAPAEPAAPVLTSRSPAVLALAVVAGLCVANLYYVIPLLPSIAASAHRPASDFAPLLSVTQVGYALGLLFIVPLGDTVDRRRLSTALLACSCLALAVVPFASGIAFFGLFAVLGLVSVTAMVVVSWAADFARDEERGRVVGAVMTGLLLGSLLCRSFAGAVAQVASWQIVYWVAAAFMAVSLVAVRRAIPAGPSTGRVDGPGYLRLIGSLPGIMLRTPRVLERCLYGALGFGAFSVFWTVLPLRLTAAPFRYGPVEIGLFGFLGAAGVLGASVAGRLADRHRQTFTTLAAFIVVAGMFLALGSNAGGLAMIIVGAVLLDLAVQAAHIANQSVIYAGNPLMRSRITTAYMVCYFGGGALGSALAASAWRSSGWSAACVLGAGFAAAALLVFGSCTLFRRLSPRTAA